MSVEDEMKDKKKRKIANLLVLNNLFLANHFRCVSTQWTTVLIVNQVAGQPFQASHYNYSIRCYSIVVITKCWKEREYILYTDPIAGFLVT